MGNNKTKSANSDGDVEMDKEIRVTPVKESANLRKQKGSDLKNKTTGQIYLTQRRPNPRCHFPFDLLRIAA